jgi:hypothetical protein
MPEQRLKQRPPTEDPADAAEQPSKVLGRPFVKGRSGNPRGRPPIEPRVRHYARKYDLRMCRVLASLAEDVKAPWSERRRAAMDLIAVGSGRPAKEMVISPTAPLVALNLGGLMVSPEQAYRAMVEGALPADPLHEAFRPALEPPLALDALEAEPPAPEAEPPT